MRAVHRRAAGLDDGGNSRYPHFVFFSALHPHFIERMRQCEAKNQVDRRARTRTKWAQRFDETTLRPRASVNQLPHPSENISPLICF
jgi:hypothetical protein